MTIKPDAPIRRAVFTIGAMGAMLFTLLFASTWLFPTVLESWAREAIAHEVQQGVDTHLDGLHNSAIGKMAGRMIDKNNREKTAARDQIANEMPSPTGVLIEAVVEAMRNPDCPCRNKMAPPSRMADLIKPARKSENDTLNAAIGKLDQTNGKLKELIESKYRDAAQSLLNEIRIFSGANSFVCLLLALTAVAWKRSAGQLLAPTVVLVGAAALTATMYLLKQNWLQTILFSDYVGLWYFPYLGIALAFMADLVFNRGRASLFLTQAAVLAATAPLSAGC